MLSLVGGGLLKHWRLVLFGGLALAVVIAVWLHFRGDAAVRAENDVLKADKVALELAIEVQNTTIDAQDEALENWEQAQAAWVTTVEKMQNANDEANRENRRLNDIFAKHDMGLLARARPGLIERRINDGTVDALRVLECASGSSSPGCTPDDSPAG